MKNGFQQRLTQFFPTERIIFPTLLATLVGISIGFAVVFFIKTIDLSEYLFFGAGRGKLGLLGPYAVVFIPALGGLLVGLLVTLGAKQAGGHGVPEVIKAIALKGGKIPIFSVLIKLIASAISIGSGASVGREGPAVHIGSGIASFTARIFKQSEARIKNYVACGAAAGISAVFNAPITGVMFASEIVIRDFGARALSTVVIASVSASTISRMFLGHSPAFTVPVYSVWHPLELILYFTLGILSAFVSLFMISSLDRLERGFESYQVPAWLKPAVGGFIVGCIGLYYPQVFGMCFHSIEGMLNGALGSVMLLLALVFMKAVATNVSISSGSSGGVFAPALFIGAALGGVVGKLFYNHLPFPVAPPGAYALVGMASVFAGAFHAPVTAILLVFEMTGDYRMILPIMIAVVASTSISQLFSRDSIDTISLRRSGIDPGFFEEVKVLGALQVRDAMTAQFATVHRDLPGKLLLDKMAKEKDKSIFVVNDQEQLVGLIKPEEVQKALFGEDMTAIVADDLMYPLEEHCFEDEPLSEVAHFMMERHITQMSVMDSVDPKKVVGVIKSEDIFHAYTEVTEKRSSLLSRMEHESSHASGMVQIRFVISPRSTVTGKPIKEINLPDGIVLTSIKRRQAVLIPEGNTILKARDKIWAVMIPSQEEVFRSWLKDAQLAPFTFDAAY